MALVSEHLAYTQTDIPRPFHHIVKHRVMAGVSFHYASYRSHFVGVENRPEIVRRIQLGCKHRWHPHKFVRDDDSRAVPLRCAYRLKHGNSRRRQTHVLLIFPQVLIKVTPQPELAEHPALKVVDRPLLDSRHVNQYHFRTASYTGLPVGECAPAVHDINIVQLFDFPKAGKVAGVHHPVDG